MSADLISAPPTATANASGLLPLRRATSAWPSHSRNASPQEYRRQGSFFPDWPEPRRRVDKALYAVVMEAYTGRISNRNDALVEVLGSAREISKSKVSRICQRLDERVKAFRGRSLDHARYPNVFLDVT